MTSLEFFSVIGYFVAVAVVSRVVFVKNHDVGSIGVWVWGTTTAAIGMGVVLLVVFGWPNPVYVRVKDCASALGAVVAASALAWSWFYQMDHKGKSESDTMKQVASDVSTMRIRLEAMESRLAGNNTLATDPRLQPPQEQK